MHPVSCLTRGDVAFFFGDSQLLRLQWSYADHVEVRFHGHKGDQVQLGNVVVRTRSWVRGPRSGLGEGVGAVVFMVALMSCHLALPENAPLSSYRSGQQVRAWGYGQALKALREVFPKFRGKPQEYAFHSLWLGNALTLAAGGDVSERVTQREGRWKPDVRIKSTPAIMRRTRERCLVIWHLSRVYRDL